MAGVVRPLPDREAAPRWDWFSFLCGLAVGAVAGMVLEHFGH